MKIDRHCGARIKAFLLGSIVLMSGCVPYHKLVKGEFPQGERKKTHYRKIAPYLQEARLYEGFSSLLECNALWFSDAMRRLYVDMYTERRGSESSFKNAMLRRELEENKHWITFYVLIATPQIERSALSDSDPFWTLSLQVPSGEYLTPEVIKEVDLEPEVRYFFGDKYTPFKRSFLVRFALPNSDALKVLGEIKLCVESMRHKACLMWDSSSLPFLVQPTTIKHESQYEDFYWV